MCQYTIQSNSSFTRQFVERNFTYDGVDSGELLKQTAELIEISIKTISAVFLVIESVYENFRGESIEDASCIGFYIGWEIAAFADRSSFQQSFTVLSSPSHSFSSHKTSRMASFEQVASGPQNSAPGGFSWYPVCPEKIPFPALDSPHKPVKVW